MEESTYLEDFLSSIEFLPNDLRRDFELLREHDKDSCDTLRELYDCEQTFIQRAVRIVGENSYGTNSSETALKMNEIQSLRQRAKQRMAQKVHISSNMLKDLEKFIRKLDSDLTYFESELRTCGEFEQLSRGVEPGSDVSPITREARLFS
jgi:inhibitor of growth protein 4